MYSDTDFIIWLLPRTYAGHQQSSKLYCQHTDFATELTRWLFALIDYFSPFRQMLKEGATPHSGRWFQSRAVTFKDLGLKISHKLSSSGRKCLSTAQTHQLLLISLVSFLRKTVNRSVFVPFPCPWLLIRSCTQQISHSSINLLAHQVFISLDVQTHVPSDFQTQSLVALPVLSLPIPRLFPCLHCPVPYMFSMGPPTFNFLSLVSWFTCFLHPLSQICPPFCLTFLSQLYQICVLLSQPMQLHLPLLCPGILHHPESQLQFSSLSPASLLSLAHLPSASFQTSLRTPHFSQLCKRDRFQCFAKKSVDVMPDPNAMSPPNFKAWSLWAF